MSSAKKHTSPKRIDTRMPKDMKIRKGKPTPESAAIFLFCSERVNSGGFEGVGVEFVEVGHGVGSPSFRVWWWLVF